MPVPRTIITATDFSASAQQAVGQAVHLAQAWNAGLHLVHVFNDSIWASLKAIYDPQSWSVADPAGQASSRLVEMGKHIARESGVKVETSLLHGRASQQIGQFISGHRADLLVVGEHGENLISDLVLGGTALKVLEAARIPVLLVRRTTPAAYRNILIATDFSASSARATRHALEYFPDSRHKLVHAWLLPFEGSMRMGGAREEDIERYREREFAAASTRLEAFARECESAGGAKRLERLALHGSPAAVALGQAEAGACDLIAIGKHGGEYLDELLLGSVTQNILYHAVCDVLLSP